MPLPSPALAVTQYVAWIMVAVPALFLVVGIAMRIRARKPFVESVGDDGKKRKQVVILGGGFGGVYTAKYLEDLLGSGDDYEITLVSKENYMVFQPMLPEVISGSIGITDTVTPLRDLLRRTHVHIREIESIDLKAQTVTLAPGFVPRQLVLRYDHLVIGMGTVTDFRGMRGLPEHALPFKNLADALNLRNHLIRALEEAAIERANPALRKQLLTFVVAGGGFSGVEVVAETNDFVREAARNYRGIDPKEIQVILLHGQDRILPEMDEKLALFAQKKLRERGVDIRLKTRLQACTAEAAILGDNTKIETKTLVSTIPASPHPVIDALKDIAKTKNGRIDCDGTLQVKGATNVWAIGDCASIPNADGQLAPPTAQHAIREGKTLAGNIVASMRGGEKKTFNFAGLGKMGSLGHRSAVAEVFGFRISGIIAWFMWRTIYLMKMPGWGRRLKVASSWTLDVVLPPDIVQLRLSASQGIAQEHFEPGQEIFHQGDVGDRIYIVLSGEAEVIVAKDGVEKIVGKVQAGDYVGEMALLNQTSRGATVRCTTPMDALSLPKREFGLLTKNVPELKASFEAVMAKRQKRVTGPREGANLPPLPEDAPQATETAQTK